MRKLIARITFATLLVSLSSFLPFLGICQESSNDYFFSRNFVKGDRDSMEYYLRKGANVNCLLLPESDCAEAMPPAVISILLEDTLTLSLLRNYRADQDEVFTKLAVRAALFTNNLKILKFIINLGYTVYLDKDTKCESPYSILLDAAETGPLLFEAFSGEIDNWAGKFDLKPVELKRQKIHKSKEDYDFNPDLAGLFFSQFSAQQQIEPGSCNFFDLVVSSHIDPAYKVRLTRYILKNHKERFSSPRYFEKIARIAVRFNDKDLFTSIIEMPELKSNTTFKESVYGEILKYGSPQFLEIMRTAGYIFSEEFSPDGYYLTDGLFRTAPRTPADSENPQWISQATVLNIGYFLNQHYSVGRRRDITNTPLEQFCEWFYYDTLAYHPELLSLLLQHTQDSISYNRAILSLYRRKQMAGFDSLFRSRAKYSLSYPKLFAMACSRNDENLLTNLMSEINDPMADDYDMLDASEPLGPIGIHFYSLLYLKLDLINAGSYFDTDSKLQKAMQDSADVYTGLNEFAGYVDQKGKISSTELVESLVRPERLFYKETGKTMLEKRVAIRIGDIKSGTVRRFYRHSIKTSLSFLDFNDPATAFILRRPVEKGYKFSYNFNASTVIPKMAFYRANPLVYTGATVVNNSGNAVQIYLEQANLFYKVSPGEKMTLDRTKGDIAVGYKGVTGTEVDLSVDIILNESYLNASVYGEGTEEASTRFNDENRLKVYFYLYELKRNFDTTSNDLNYDSYLVIRNILSKKAYLLGYPAYLTTTLDALAVKLADYNTNAVELMKFSFENQSVNSENYASVNEKIRNYLQDAGVQKSQRERDLLEEIASGLSSSNSNYSKTSELLASFRDNYFHIMNDDIMKFQRYIMELAQFFDENALNELLRKKIFRNRPVKKVFYEGSILIRDNTDKGKMILEFLK